MTDLRIGERIRNLPTKRNGSERFTLILQHHLPFFRLLPARVHSQLRNIHTPDMMSDSHLYQRRLVFSLPRISCAGKALEQNARVHAATIKDPHSVRTDIAQGTQIIATNGSVGHNCSFFPHK